jgi:NAD(P)-dependent dehydrogenase (short-subunit alcohol dehydrogenase family)
MIQHGEAATAIVTGGGRRLGRAIARDFAARGWRVAVHHHASRDAAAALVAEIEAAGGCAIALEADLADSGQLTPLIDACAEALGPASCLVNNAACFEWDSLESLDAAGWNAHVDINLRAPVLLTQAFAKALPVERTGVVINILDQKVWRPSPDYFSYTVAKSALWSATRIMAQALAPRIRVNAVGPGPVFRSHRQTEADFEQECRDTLLASSVSAGQVSSAIHFLIENAAVTGQMIAVDSGQHLSWPKR